MEDLPNSEFSKSPIGKSQSEFLNFNQFITSAAISPWRSQSKLSILKFDNPMNIFELSLKKIIMNLSKIYIYDLIKIFPFL